MPHAKSALEIRPLPAKLSKSSEIGAEVILPVASPLLNLSSFSSDDADTIKQALYKHSVLVFRKQSGIDPDILFQIGKLFDPNAPDVHSGGEKQVDDEKNILARNMGQRVPTVPQVCLYNELEMFSLLTVLVGSNYWTRKP